MTAVFWAAIKRKVQLLRAVEARSANNARTRAVGRNYLVGTLAAVQVRIAIS